jgi:deoxyribose-phosphate aldolase
MSLSDALGHTRTIDAVGVEARAADLAKRSLKKEAKVFGLRLALSMIDLTTLEGKDTRGKVWALCQKALRPDPLDDSVPPCAAVCVYPAMIGVVREAVAGSSVRAAAVATGFPSGQTTSEVKLLETKQAVELGAQEIDMVISRGALLAGEYAFVYEEIAAVRQMCGAAHLKVILETGELGSYDQIRRASFIAMAAGADFIKTSTGKIAGATLPIALTMLEAIRDYHSLTGARVGMKPAGNIQTAKDALAYLVMLYETLGAAWMTPELFRFGASSLANDLLMQLRKERTGRYQSPDHFTQD